ncbi:TPA: hypothetical protein MO340_004219 [Salmonella enterica subsp. salamae serovar 35:g,m,s,t:-]|nr:hypothetical protein [Salmonella enterica subsp. salamae serovar 35:g,m,s,t:-]HCA3549691.1 hypothetical protein [Salmonella enterica subsp. salamae serovar 35:g,m,s,t:-]
MAKELREIKQTKIIQDARPLGDRFAAYWLDPTRFRISLIGMIVLQYWTAAIWPIWSVFLLFLIATFKETPLIMPMRVPKDIGGHDPSDDIEYNVEVKRWFGLYSATRTMIRNGVAGGILYLGSLRTDDRDNQGREVWVTNSDSRMHMTLAGTTGSGKTETLLALTYNSFCWGSGAIFADGKADLNLPFCIWSLMRRLGMEDNFLILNFLLGGSDPFEKIVDEQKKPGPLDMKRWGKELRQSNSFNPFAGGSSDFALQLTTSLLPKASGESGQWQEKAINLADAIIRVLRYKDLKSELVLGIEALRKYLTLEELAKLYIEGTEGKIPPEAFASIKAYFETGLPGFNPSLADSPEKWNDEVRNQHGFLTGQFARMLGMLNDSYGFVFKNSYPDVDILDVVINNRTLVVLIPSMEKSGQEAAALGKLVIANIKLMIAMNLGMQLEGTADEVLNTRATNAPVPYPIITDEIGYYYAQGLAVIYAQARALGFFMCAAFQDQQGLKRGEGADEVASLIANTKIKWVLALEDPDDTFELFRKAAGQAYYAVSKGYDIEGNGITQSHNDQDQTHIELKDRIAFQDLKALKAGEGYAMLNDRFVSIKSFYIPDDKKKSIMAPRINRFIQVTQPCDIEKLQFISTPINQKQNKSVQTAAATLSSVEIIRLSARFNRKAPDYPELNDPILDAVSKESEMKHPDSNSRASALYETVINNLDKAKELNGNKLFFHSVHKSKPAFISHKSDVSTLNNMYKN